MEERSKKFNPGRIVVTRGVHEKMEHDIVFKKMFVPASLGRHLCGDWGNLDPEDAALNDDALKNGDGRLFSSYKIPDRLLDGITDDKIWIITEWDRSTTTILFPSEY